MNTIFAIQGKEINERAFRYTCWNIKHIPGLYPHIGNFWFHVCGNTSSIPQGVYGCAVETSDFATGFINNKIIPTEQTFEMFTHLFHDKGTNWIGPITSTLALLHVYGWHKMVYYSVLTDQPAEFSTQIISRNLPPRTFAFVQQVKREEWQFMSCYGCYGDIYTNPNLTHLIMAGFTTRESAHNIHHKLNAMSMVHGSIMFIGE